MYLSLYLFLDCQHRWSLILKVFWFFSINWKQNSMYRSVHNLTDLSEHYVLVHTELFWKHEQSSSQRLAQVFGLKEPAARHNRGESKPKLQVLRHYGGDFFVSQHVVNFAEQVHTSTPISRIKLYFPLPTTKSEHFTLFVVYIFETFWYKIVL